MEKDNNKDNPLKEYNVPFTVRISISVDQSILQSSIGASNEGYSNYSREYELE